MNGYLLDTHALLWGLFTPKRLSATAREIMEDLRIPVFVNAATFWEISLKFALGKLSLRDCTPSDLVLRMPEISRDSALKDYEAHGLKLIW